jgi:pyridoxal phosphate enzyme (YggS family)
MFGRFRLSFEQTPATWYPLATSLHQKNALVTSWPYWKTRRFLACSSAKVPLLSQVMDYTALGDNLRLVRDEIARIQACEGLKTDVRIVAVTKGHSTGAVEAAAAAGLLVVGENRVQEAVDKQDAVGELDIDWHLIGHLQTNKAKLVPGRFALVHSVDSVRIAEALGKAAARSIATAGPLDVLIQVNVAREPQKNGCTPEAVPEVAAYVAGARGLAVRGLMTMAPFVSSESEQRKAFGALRLLRESLEKEGYDLPELSMGMSNDYRAAVAEGATILRLGTVLFGERGV